MITITDTELEDVLKNIVQKKVSFRLNNKQWRTGKVLLFKQNGYYIELTIKNNKEKLERFEIPIPFKILQNIKNLIFSYKFIHLSNNKQIIDLIKKTAPTNKNRFFDNYMELVIQ